jgi:hypothetical protein
MKVMQMVAMRYHSQMFLDLEEELIGMVLIRCSHYQSRYFFSGGSDKITYAVSGSHLGQEGIIGGDKWILRKARVSLGADVLDRLKLKTNVIYTYLIENH